MKKKLSRALQQGIKRYQLIKKQELEEAKSWIEKGEEGGNWHWESPEKEKDCLEGSYEFFQTSIEEKTEENIIRFVGQEIYDKWNDYPDDNITNRCNHARALYNYIKLQLYSNEQSE